ncbi:Putative Thioredoxin domain-containing protein [Septoria linicola]|uniref:Thioredoxin domain-containing protein n=1 Tax=Septoria linicola TaxID=215465 RepID=A0A9Q9AD40_9PEZI|nr:putative Thioredoxin domain-containing protein [Septoria linicola]USW47344.1 Putative Thioredoxin domain-containing protein [Septoria linicola]
MALRVIRILDRAKHDEIVANSKNIPTVLHVSNSSLPACRAFSPKYEELAKAHASDNIAFAEMDFNAETSYLFKFSPNQIPVTVAMFGDRWAQTVMGADMSGIEKMIGIMLSESGKGQ